MKAARFPEHINRRLGNRISGYQDPVLAVKRRNAARSVSDIRMTSAPPADINYVTFPQRADGRIRLCLPEIMRHFRRVHVCRFKIPVAAGVIAVGMRS